MTCPASGFGTGRNGGDEHATDTATITPASAILRIAPRYPARRNLTGGNGVQPREKVDVPEQLVEACRRGDAAAFDQLVRSTHRSVYTLVARIVGDPDEAADVTQEVYVRVWRGLRRFRGDARFSTWLYRVAANAALSHVKRRRDAAAPVAPSDLPELPVGDRTDQQADADLLERALLRLPPEARAVVVLKDVYGWTCEELGRAMGTSEGAIKVRLFRARKRLADELSASGVVVPMKRKKSS